MSLRGVGPNTTAQLLITAGGNPDRLRSDASFVALCGTAPVPASSGKTRRYRLSRGGDRAANRVLHTIALVRMSCDDRTRDYVRAQHAKRRTHPEILRLLKRDIAREVFKSLTRCLVAPEHADAPAARSLIAPRTRRGDSWPCRTRPATGRVAQVVEPEDDGA